VATLSAVAELVINLSIAQRSHLIYGATHTVARKSASKAIESLARTLELQAPVAIHFTPKAVFCGSHCLERSHPIYRTFAERLWKLGIAAVTFHAGAGEGDLVPFVEALASAARDHVTREQAEELLRRAGLQKIEVQFLRQVVTHATQEELKPLAPGEAEKQWEKLITDLAELSVPVAGDDGPVPGVPPLHHGEVSPDYAGAVIDYLKQMQRTQQQDAVLQETDFGQQISGLLGSINPELRRQLVAAAVVAPDVSPETLHKLINVVGYDHLVGALRRLNESGQSMPPTALRTLSMLALTQRGGAGPPSLGATGVSAPGAEAARSPGEAQALLDQLLTEEQADRYTSEEYERTLRDVEQRAQRAVVLRPLAGKAFVLPAEDGERHYLKVARQLLAEPEADPEIARSVCRESQRSYSRFVESASVAPCREAMQLARDAQEKSGEPPVGPWVWETPETLERLRNQLVEGRREEAESSGELLVAVGAPSVPYLVEVLASSLSLSARRRALAALEALPESPAPALVPLLHPSQPWYLQRNAAYVLRRRRDPAGAAAAKALWRHAEPRVRLELVGYLLAVGDPERLRHLEEVLADRDSEVAAAAARNAVKEPTPEVVAAVLRRAEQVPPDQVGMPLHLALLRALAASKAPQAVRYVAELPKRRKPLLPWQRERFRQAVAAMVAEES
jgi:hypothetical protein